MDFKSILDGVRTDTSWSGSLGLFSPELALCVSIVALLLVRLVNADRWLKGHWVALTGAFVAFGLAFYQFDQLKDLLGSSDAGTGVRQYMFTRLLVYDAFTVFFRLFLLLFLILTIALTVLSGIPDQEDGPDFYTLLLGSTIGMMLMVSANHLLILFLGIEMTSVPSYAMVGFLKGRRKSSEGALKYVVFGAGAAGVMLYGISLLAGLTGTADFASLSRRLGQILQQGGVFDATARTVVLALLMVMIGFAFKLSIFPFHFWCPDAFEGAAAEVGGFLSVASKGAAFALLVRFLLAFVGDDTGALANINLSIGVGLGVIAAVTATFGNLAAYTQANIKRLLAYSTIAHAGYMLMAVAAMVVLMNGSTETENASANRAAAVGCLEALLYYLSVYLFMNLGAFAIVALIRNEIYSEEIEDYAGLSQQAPLLSVCLLVCFFSLIGLPPMGGFFGKFAIFASLFEAGKVHRSMWVILAIGGLNTVFSLFFYLRVLKTMFLQKRPEGARTMKSMPLLPIGAYILLITLPVLGLGILVSPLSRTANHVAGILIPGLR